ncbi:AbrB/MazE/SpoVT family DNA-binding domain-containing protein [Priestia endophytica]
MKTTGIVRKIDELGRIVIPKELRKALNLEKRDPVEIFVDGEQIVLKKYQHPQACIITGEITSQNYKIGNKDIVVSPEGAQVLLKELLENMEEEPDKDLLTRSL